MAKDNPTEGRLPGDAGELCCEEWECLLAEALEGSLGGEQAAALERHRQQCSACSQAFEQSRRGAQWLRFLGSEPEVPADLVDKILVVTSGGGVTLPGELSPVGKQAPLWCHPAASGARRAIAPGLIMTAAMAFFSLAVTINLLGVTPRGFSLSEMRLAGLHLSDLRPSAAGVMLTRQYYSIEERGAKYYDNLLWVREAEAEAHELAPSDEEQPEGSSARPAHPSGQSPTSRNGSALPGTRDSRTGDVAVYRSPAPRSPLHGGLA